MIVKILGALDIGVALLFWVYGIFHLESISGLVFILGLFLLVKGLIFVATMDVASAFDVLAGLAIIIGVSFELPRVIVIIISILILQKGIFSMLG
jgi:Sec-independent protein secretion pathway component TatC